MLWLTLGALVLGGAVIAMVHGFVSWMMRRVMSGEFE